MAKKAQFATKIGLVAATVGSAIGLGNVWRFPAETQENGGAAFLLLYVVCVLLLGIPVMLGEMSLGRGGRSDARFEMVDYRRFGHSCRILDNGVLYGCCRLDSGISV